MADVTISGTGTLKSTLAGTELIEIEDSGTSKHSTVQAVADLASVAWGSITGTLSSQSDLNTALAAKAPLASPTLTGTPLAPTAAVDTNTTQIATTAYVIAQASASGDGTPAMDGTAARGTSTHWARADHVHPTDTSRAALASPTFTGTPAAPTATAGTNTTQLATTAFVTTAVSNFSGTLAAIATSGSYTDITDYPGGTTTFLRADGTFAAPSAGSVAWGSITGTLSSQTDLQSALDAKAPLASPTLTGTPLAPTAAVDTNTTQIATTAYVIAQASAAGDGTPAMDGTAARGTSTHWARADHVHPTDTSLAPKASPTFTGTPAAPTATAGTNTTQIATTAFVTGGISDFGATLATIATTGSYTDITDYPGGTTTFLRADGSFATPSGGGDVTGPGSSTDGDVVLFNGTTGKIIKESSTALSALALLASPTFTGTPAAPTATAGTNTTQIATTAFVATSFAPLASPALTGNPTAPTQTGTDNSTKIATTAFVKGLAYATLASPALTGTPTAPTASTGTDTTQIATTAFVQASVTAINVQSKSAAYTAVLSDKGSCLYHPSSDVTPRTFTIPANSSVAYAVGTTLSFVNLSAGNVTIAITTDTMYLAGTGTTGSRTLAQYGTATALKVASTTWIISGVGLT